MHTTTITVNGHGGSRLLAVLGAKFALPPVLASLAAGAESVEVMTDLAEQAAEFVEQHLPDLLAEPVLLFSPHVGDSIATVRDGLFEVEVSSRGAPRIWRYIARGTRGRMIAHWGDIYRVELEVSREVAHVRPRSLTGVRFWASAPR